MSTTSGRSSKLLGYWQRSIDYFLGLLVPDTSDRIQDGQQRLAITLVLAS